MGESMSKKGFTLIELLVVIVILAIIALVAVPVIIGVINSSKEKAYQEQERAIVTAARNYIAKNSKEMPTMKGASKCIPVETLKNAGLLKDQTIQNPVGVNYKDYTEKDDNFNGGVLVENNNNNYTYNYVDDCSTITFTGTIYRNNQVGAGIGSSIIPVSGTKYVITNGEYVAPVGPYNSQNECQTALTEHGAPEEFYCEKQTGTFGGIGEYTKDASGLNKKHYLKHEVVDNIITASYACFVTDKEYCMQGGNASYYAANQAILQSQDAWFNNSDGYCYIESEFSGCYSYNKYNIGANSYGEVYTRSSDILGCIVDKDGFSHCNKREESIR